MFMRTGLAAVLASAQPSWVEQLALLACSVQCLIAMPGVINSYLAAIAAQPLQARVYKESPWELMGNAIRLVWIFNKGVNKGVRVKIQ